MPVRVKDARTVRRVAHEGTVLPNRYLLDVPARLRPAAESDVAQWLSALSSGAAPPPEVLRGLTKHFLALLSLRAPGRSVEVRVPPYAAVQCVEGTRHTRGTPPATVEMDAPTWIALATGELQWSAALEQGRVVASGERSDLSPLLPLR